MRQTRGLPHQQRRHNPFDDNPDAAAQADKHDKDVTEQERLQEEKDRQLAQGMHNSEEEYPSLPGTDDDKMGTTIEDQAEGEEVESEFVAGGMEKVEEDDVLLVVI